MRILVFNTGSSSLKFGLFVLEPRGGIHPLFEAEFEAFGNSGCRFHYQDSRQHITRADSSQNIEDALPRIGNILEEFGHDEYIDAIGHRVAHGGDAFAKAAVIDEECLLRIEEFTPLAPLHNPASLVAINIARALWPACPHVAVFDTAFHNTIPPSAHTYAIPESWRDMGVRRYGFHGTSHRHIATASAHFLGEDIKDLKIISAHLGSGASICAIGGGQSVDTSMGMTALEGLVMATRCGDIDPGIFAFLERSQNLTAAQVEAMLYRESGLKAVAGEHDMRLVENMAAMGNAKAILALDVYAYRVRKYIGAYAAIMNGIDVLAFTAGVGENAPKVREKICADLDFLGLYLDPEKNNIARPREHPVTAIHRADSRVKILVIRAREQQAIAQETAQALGY